MKYSFTVMWYIFGKVKEYQKALMILPTNITYSKIVYSVNRSTMDLDPIDFFPGYDPYIYTRQRSRQSCCCTVITHMLAVLFSIGICGITLYYYENNFTKNIFPYNTNIDEPKNQTEPMYIKNILDEMKTLKDNMEKTNIWRKHLEELFAKIYFQQESIFDKKVEEALDMYDADKIGLFDYASVYAYGSVISTPCTSPYPANKSINFFSLLNFNVMSDPESLLQPENLPGNCFAFHGSEGRIRIKLGRKITIKAVTMDHVKLLDNGESAPKNFEVFGLQNPNDDSGVLLGMFTYDQKGRPYQTFMINSNLTYVPFEYVELHILDNYGNQEFTCVYRFRVHDMFKNKTT
nr:SUN domain-containing protein 2-like isoform X1 [Leptinotarsa decemlineata]